ncbi:MAG: aspartate aminotransferase family protein [Myxococcales bacterium]|nr:aspartate aminotransferase family protein [Myxococcales bacterium]
MRLPATGLPHADVLALLDQYRSGDADWRSGRTFSLVYFAGDDVLALLKDASLRCFSENALNPMAFPSLRRMETEILAMVADRFGHADAAGTLTSGGTESVLMAVKTARDWARADRPEVTAPEMLLPTTVHPAFQKAAHYFGVRPVHVPVGADFRVDVAAARALLTPNTVLVVGSAPAYPHGVIDPIPALAALAAEHGILCHVDACLGGMMLPFAESLGWPIAPWDFRVPGVTSISADLHKYGWAAKGASLVLYRDRELRRHQYMGFADWPGGLWGSPSAAGTRPGGPIAAAWAVLHYLGEEGYLRHARTTLAAAKKMRDGIECIGDLRVLGEPAISVFAFTSAIVDPYVLGDAMEARGWHLDRQQRPAALHAMITPAHAPHVDAFLVDLAAAWDDVKDSTPAEVGSAAMYGLMGSIPDRTAAAEMIVAFLDALDAPADDPASGPAAASDPKQA